MVSLYGRYHHEGQQASYIAQSMIVTVWNAAIAGGGIVGGLLLDHLGTTVIPWAATVFLLCALMIVVVGSGSGFTRMPRNG